MPSNVHSRPEAALPTHSSRAIEALRACAALAVVAYHLQVVTHGFDGNYGAAPLGTRVLVTGQHGVVVFFVLSGYLLFLPFARAALGSGENISLGRYAVNRAMRILPLYYIAVLILLLLEPSGLTWDQAWRHLAMVQNDTVGIRLLDGPLWSLVCEVQFYALLPLLALALARLFRGDSRRALLVMLGLIAIARLMQAMALSWSPIDVWRFSLPANFVSFTPGMLLAVLDVHLQGRSQRGLRPRTARLVTLIAAASWVPAFVSPTLDDVLLAGALTVAAVVFARQRQREEPASAGRRGHPMATLGLVSYSLYVWHLPVLTRLSEHNLLTGRYLLDVVIAVPACCLIAVVSFRMIEEPALRLRRRWMEGRRRADEPVAQGPRPAALPNTVSM